MSVSLEVPRDLASLPEVMRAVDAFISDQHLRFSVELALEEVFTNVVRHNAGGKGPIRIDLAIQDGELIVRVTDPDTPPFDLDKDAPPVNIDQPLADRTPGGLGIHLVKKMMDRIEYSHRNRTGTITLHKRMR